MKCPLYIQINFHFCKNCDKDKNELITADNIVIKWH